MVLGERGLVCGTALLASAVLTLKIVICFYLLSQRAGSGEYTCPASFGCTDVKDSHLFLPALTEGWALVSMTALLACAVLTSKIVIFFTRFHRELFLPFVFTAKADLTTRALFCATRHDTTRRFTTALLPLRRPCQEVFTVASRDDGFKISPTKETHK